MTDLFARRFAACRAEGRAALVTFLTACDPDRETSQALLDALPAAGADVIELGMPFTDPMADGPAIQRAAQRSLQAGGSLAGTLAQVRAFRTRNQETPLVLMGYYNPVYRFGPERFAREAAAAGVNGVILVDLPPEESGEIIGFLAAHGLAFIPLVAPTTGDDRLPEVLASAEGFVYHVSIAGVTGTRAAAVDTVAATVSRIRAHTDLPVAVGFGIRTPAQAGEMGRVADGVVVGSALVQEIAAHLEAGEARDVLLTRVTGVVRDLAAGVRAAAT